MPTGLRLCGRGRHLPTAGPRVPPPSRKLAECCLRSGCPAAVLPGQALCLPRRCPTCPVLSLQGRVCGLCGNFDDNALNDFTTRSQSVVGDVLEFGNSWKFSPSCPDALAPRDPCTANPYRRSWAQKQCSIINSATFSACRSQVSRVGVGPVSGPSWPSEDGLDPDRCAGHTVWPSPGALPASPALPHVP